MSAKSQRSETRVQLHAVTWPEATLGALSAIILACILLVLLVIAGAIVTVALERLTAPRQSAGSLLLLLGMAPLSVALSLPVLIVYTHIAAWRTRKKSKGRWHRLCRMLKHPEAATRYPHRAMEHAFYAAPYSTKRRMTLFRESQPRHLIIRNALTPGDRNTPKPNEILFEPIDLVQDVDRATEYFFASMLAQGAPIERGEAPTAAPLPFGKRLRRVAGKTKQLLWKTLWLVSFALMAYQTVRYGWKISTLYWGVILLMWLWALTSHLLYERRWWIVPGGLVCREFRFWRSAMKVYYFTPENTPLFMDCRKAYGYVLYEGKAMRFRLIYLGWWALAAAWMSTATPPTMAQIETFIGFADGNGS